VSKFPGGRPVSIINRHHVKKRSRVTDGCDARQHTDHGIDRFVPDLKGLDGRAVCGINCVAGISKANDTNATSTIEIR